MPDEIEHKVRHEIGHVLFIDIVGYSKLLISEQSAQLQKLKEIVRGTEQFRAAEGEGKLLRLPTGDGGALVFRTSPEAPVECAIEIHRALQQPPGSKEKPQLRLRMGIHSGPVNEVSDLNEQLNVAGAGINFAQRVMDCGDAGHVLLSKHVADDIDDYPEWRPHLHDLGECEVKHGVRVHLFNLYGDDFGNPAVPGKVQSAARLAKKASRKPWLIAAAVMALAVIVAAMFWQRTHRTSALSGNAMPEKSIAVLPFENLSSDKENAYFADGVQDEILTNLARIADLKVISRTSVMQYKTGVPRNLREIGQQLGVAHLLEGSVQRAANKVRVNAQLIDARNDTHLWAQTYDRDLADVFAIQSEIAKAIADQLQAKLSPQEKAAIERPPTTNLAAFDLYDRAREIWRSLTTSSGSGGTEKFKEIIALLDEAVSRDPMFVPALCTLAKTHSYMHWQGADPAVSHLALAKKALEAAERLQPDSGDVHLARGLYYYHGSRDYRAALGELALAERGLPNNADVRFTIALVERRQGRWAESTRHIEEALRLDPRNVQFISELAGSNYYVLRRYAEAVKIIDNTLAWDSGDFGLALLGAQMETAWKADLHRWEKVVEGEAARNADPNDLATARLLLAFKQREYHAAERILSTLTVNEFDDDGFFTPREFSRGVVARGLGDHARAQQEFEAARVRAAAAVRERADDARSWIALAQVDAALRRKDEAIQEGEKATSLLPIEKDVLNGNQLLVRLTQIYAQVGELDRALDLLAKVIPQPDGSNYGSLMLDEVWDPLRGDPRFEKIVQSLAPKS